MADTPKQLEDLIARFDQNIEAYQNQAYNETQVRREFIDPFFEALGWDVANKAGHAEAYKDVIHEDAIKVGGATKAPDYSFRVGGTRKFFLEAKKPAVSIKDDTSPAYQLRRYAWSAKLPLSILTNFAELAVYDCRLPPREKDKASTGRVLYLAYKEYDQRWDEIAKIFSKEAVLQGSFDKFAEAGKGKKGTSQVDAEFLAEIESWREALAKNLALRNPRLSVRDLNFAVQRTIDRIIFLRMCEDRGVEQYEQLQALLNGENAYKRLHRLYRLADEKYNSGLFHFEEEKGRAEAPDKLSLNLKIDDKALKDIIRRLYYPESPYEFSVLGGDILGNVYEQFLGKVIRLTAGHHAVVEDKPEVKKAGGVYYTPAYIVDYIVNNTVGKLCEGKSPREIGKLRILDPACGSGSFLIGAYTSLLNHHRDWYVKEGSQKHTKEIYQGSGGQWLLTTQEKKRILLNNIYGVDIDSQAVEVTKLSLLLKVLEGESEETIGKNLKLFHERALPDLGNNVKCGNSLIGPNFHQNKQMSLLGDEDRYRINAFDWHSEFPDIFPSPSARGTKGEGLGGFDAVIGNPPYVRIQALQEWAPIEVEHYKTAFKSASKGNYDIYVVFVEKGLSLLNKNGRLGFILPHKFFNAQYGEPLREVIAKGKHLAEVIHFGDQQVFAGATTYTSLLFLDKAGSSQCRVVKVKDLTTWRGNGGASEGFVPATRITAAEWNFTVGEGTDLFEKLRKMPLKLGDLTHLFVGLQTDADDVFILEEVRREKDRVLCESASTGQQHWFEQDHLKPFLKGSLNIRRYYLSDVTKRLIFPYDVKDGKAPLIDEKEYRRRYPLAWHYLEQNRERLASRNKGRMGKEWYGYVYKKNHTLFGALKLLVPAIATGSCFAADLEGKYYFVGSGGGGGGGYGITLRESTKFSYAYLLGLLNSKLLSGYLKGTSTPFRGGFIALNRQYIEQLPIRGIDLSDPAEKARHDKMVVLVERMLDLRKKLAAAKNPNDKTNLQREIETTDRQIDQVVYLLYGLTEGEIKIVEEETGK
jgi:type I restriction-modification system DNA methylase subunit